MAIKVNAVGISDDTYTVGTGIESYWIEYQIGKSGTSSVTTWDATYSHTENASFPCGIMANEWGDTDAGGGICKPYITGVIEVVGRRSMFGFPQLDRLNLSSSMIAEAWCNVSVANPVLTQLESTYSFEQEAKGNVENIYFGPNDYWCCSQTTTVQTTGIPISLTLQGVVPTGDSTLEPRVITSLGSIANVSHNVWTKIDVTDFIKSYCDNSSKAYRGFQLYVNCEGGVNIADVTDWTNTLKGFYQSPYWLGELKYEDRITSDNTGFAKGSITTKNLEYTTVSIGTVYVKLANLKELSLHQRVFYCDPVTFNGPPRMQA